MSRSPDAERLATIALTTLPNVGPVAARRLIDAHGGATNALDTVTNPRTADDAREVAGRAMDRAARMGARCVIASDADFPPALLELEEAPLAIWVVGDVATMAAPPAVAVVGTREASPYGERATNAIVSPLARAGVSIVSGLARGIDGMAHRSALAAGGRTVAVLGTGVDVHYPASNRRLQDEIAERGALVSELMPGTRAHGGSFPRRNRLIAALGTVTIVVEAAARSGANLTVDYALALGRTVAAVPGPIDSPLSHGTNMLIREGASACTSAADALSFVGLSAPELVNPLITNSSERAVWDALFVGAPTMDILCTRVALEARMCLAAVTALEIRGLVECAPSGEVRRRVA